MECSNPALINSPACWDKNSFAHSGRALNVSLPTETSECLSLLLKRNESLSQAQLKTLRTEITSIVSQHVINGRGFALVKLPWHDDITCKDLIRATTAIASATGTIMAQDKIGAKVIHVQDTGRSMAEGARYHESNASGGVHTDGPQLDKPPNLLLTACFRRARYGGDSLLASAVTLHNRLLQQRKDLLMILHNNYHFDKRGFGNHHSPTIKRPVFICSSSHFIFRYLYEYILDGHAKAKVSLSELQRDAIDTVQRMLAQDNILLKITLNPGELLIINNLRVCHGRTSFQDDRAQGAVRHLIRVWAHI